ncbi:MAG: 1-deoxy-D-xylulose-5-phosphate reductoisomerase [Pseudomonadota bacterium]|nr:1-deoxy-D-xylulose-5-phosphate reductoisomerase [Pseudomonadota bacterium]
MIDSNREKASRVAGSPRRISVLGATGSVGTSTLDLIGRDPGAYRVVALTANCKAGELAALALHHGAELAVVQDQNAYAELKAALAGSGIEAAAGAAAMQEAAARPADWIMAAIVGAAGLAPTLCALRQGTCVALANKECLVSAGRIFLDEARRHGATIVPVDSEHSAAFQSIDTVNPGGIEKLTLTASGGPFRTWSTERMASATPQDALSHPNWTMGRKITIDSATLMNKGLELIEALHLFPVRPEQLGVVIHPQSIVHCLVEYSDGSVLAQMSSPDMRTPIAYALSFPNRMYAPTKRLDFSRVGSLTFEAPDEVRFPALRVAREAMLAGGGATAALNAANEIAVDAFLAGNIGFLSISALVEATLHEAARRSLVPEPVSLNDVLSIDSECRDLAVSLLSRFARPPLHARRA